jgi:hypothetical protein
MELPMNRILAAALATAAIGALSVAAFAQAATRGGPHHRIAALDADHNDAVSQAEFDAGPAARFAELDANNDGALSAEEMQAMRGRHLRQGMHGHGEGRQGIIRGADANNDGVITREEFAGPLIAMFDQLDTNNDGRLTEDERPSRGERHGPDHGRGMANIDADGDGTVTRAEFDAAGARLFAHMDSNGDRQLTEADRGARRRGPHAAN